MTRGTTRDRLFLLAATAGGLGYLPRAPGTWGTLLGVAVYAAAAFTLAEPAQSVVLAATLVLASAATVALGSWAESYWGRKDPQRVVLDEVAGFLLVALCFRVGPFWPNVAWCFVAARLFDILKPFPARRLERLPRGWGVLLDDLMASVYAVAALHLLHLLAAPAGLQHLFRPTV